MLETHLISMLFRSGKGEIMDDAGRDLAQRLLNRISTDADFRSRLVQDHQATLEEAGFLQEMRDLSQGGDAEVAGHMLSAPVAKPGGTCPGTNPWEHTY
jgi:hypothetical protein